MDGDNITTSDEESEEARSEVRSMSFHMARTEGEPRLTGRIIIEDDKGEVSILNNIDACVILVATEEAEGASYVVGNGQKLIQLIKGTMASDSPFSDLMVEIFAEVSARVVIGKLAS